MVALYAGGTLERSDRANFATSSPLALIYALPFRQLPTSSASLCVGTYSSRGLVPLADACFVERTGEYNHAFAVATAEVERESSLTRSVWQAADDAIQLLVDRGRRARHVVVVTDGPDTGSELLPADVIQSAIAADCSLHFIHIDELPFDESLPDVYPGPIGVYRPFVEAAEATGGSYYVSECPYDTSGNSEVLGHLLAQYWEVPLEFLSSGTMLEPGSYRLAITMTVDLHGQLLRSRWTADQWAFGGTYFPADRRLAFIVE